MIHPSITLCFWIVHTAADTIRLLKPHKGTQSFCRFSKESNIAHTMFSRFSEESNNGFSLESHDTRMCIIMLHMQMTQDTLEMHTYSQSTHAFILYHHIPLIIIHINYPNGNNLLHNQHAFSFQFNQCIYLPKGHN